jgi:hypothetical protein
MNQLHSEIEQYPEIIYRCSRQALRGPDFDGSSRPTRFRIGENTAEENLPLEYIRLILSTPFLRRELKEQLKHLGVECLEEGAPYEAYGIVRQCEKITAGLETLEQVLAVEEQEPPCSK